MEFDGLNRFIHNRGLFFLAYGLKDPEILFM